MAPQYEEVLRSDPIAQHMSYQGCRNTPWLNIELTYALKEFFFLKFDLSTGRARAWTLFVVTQNESTYWSLIKS